MLEQFTVCFNLHLHDRFYIHVPSYKWNMAHKRHNPGAFNWQIKKE